MKKTQDKAYFLKSLIVVLVQLLGIYCIYGTLVESGLKAIMCAIFGIVCLLLSNELNKENLK